MGLARNAIIAFSLLSAALGAEASGMLGPGIPADIKIFSNGYVFVSLEAGTFTTRSPSGGPSGGVGPGKSNGCTGSPFFYDRMVFTLTSDANKAMLASILAARAAGKRVSYLGSDDCLVRFDTETLSGVFTDP